MRLRCVITDLVPDLSRRPLRKRQPCSPPHVRHATVNAPCAFPVLTPAGRAVQSLPNVSLGKPANWASSTPHQNARSCRRKARHHAGLNVEVVRRSAPSSRVTAPRSSIRASFRTTRGHAANLIAASRRATLSSLIRKRTFTCPSPSGRTTSARHATASAADVPPGGPGALICPHLRSAPRPKSRRHRLVELRLPNHPAAAARSCFKREPLDGHVAAVQGAQPVVLQQRLPGARHTTTPELIVTASVDGRLPPLA